MRDSRLMDKSKNFIENQSVIVVGIVRNIENTFPKDFDRINKAFSNFEKVNWYLVESGSSDNTLRMLELTSQRNDNFAYGNLEYEVTQSRTQNMALARNFYLQYLRKGSLLYSNSYVAIADFNNLNNKINEEAVLTCFERSDWDVVTANQSGRYYDAWALRHPLWSPNDCWNQHDFFRRYSKFPESAITYAMRSRMLRIPKNAEWIEVQSAFGGLAIYKTSILRTDAKYVGITKEGNAICEHVPFHEDLRANGARIFVNPAFINSHSTDHSRNLSWIFTVYRILKYPFQWFTKKLKKD
jgi:hypothetical protein